nr:MAG TPA: hypothetical protein [Caudoviricetes sp.]
MVCRAHFLSFQSQKSNISYYKFMRSKPPK